MVVVYYNTLKSKSSISTTGFNTVKLCILYREYIGAFRIVLTVNCDYFLNSINRFIFVMERKYVSCEVRTEFIYIIQKKFSLYWVKVLTISEFCRKTRRKRLKFCRNNRVLCQNSEARSPKYEAIILTGLRWYLVSCLRKHVCRQGKTSFSSMCCKNLYFKKIEVLVGGVSARWRKRKKNIWKRDVAKNGGSK
jgi:hypothetical protein